MLTEAAPVAHDASTAPLVPLPLPLLISCYIQLSKLAATAPIAPVPFWELCQQHQAEHICVQDEDRAGDRAERRGVG